MNYRNIEFPFSPEEREIVVHGRRRIVPEIPLSMQRDWQIRTLVDRAVRCDESQITQITKELQAEGLRPLPKTGVTVKQPFELPGTEGFGDNNEELKKFCLEAYDALIPHFDIGWFIAPYFRDGDDMHLSCELGIFTTDNFNGTVVE